MARKRFTAEQWQAWLAEFEQSGLTVQQSCKAKGTTANTFYNRRRRLSRGNGATFVSVLPVAAAEAEPIEVDLPGGSDFAGRQLQEQSGRTVGLRERRLLAPDASACGGSARLALAGQVADDAPPTIAGKSPTLAKPNGCRYSRA